MKTGTQWGKKKSLFFPPKRLSSIFLLLEKQYSLKELKVLLKLPLQAA